MELSDVSALVRDVADFPVPGIVFKDITPILSSAPALELVVRELASPFRGAVDLVAGVEARGFILGAPVAVELGAGFVPIRKPAKLPWRTVSQSYALEYGTDAVEMHEDAMGPGHRVLLVDDVLATGGTAAAALELLRRSGSEVVGAAFLMELSFLSGRSKLDLEHARLHSLFEYT